MKLRVWMGMLLSLLVAHAVAREPVIGGPCEGCDWVYQDLPETLGPVARIAPPAQPGEALVIEGVVRNAEGAPAADIIVYAYHTDANGLYPPASNRHGSLRGWVRTGSDGHYRFDTIRPASYPDTRIPQHVHMHVIEPGKGTYYIDDIHFSDDPMLPVEMRHADRGGRGLTTPVKDPQGQWHVQRDIVLGRNIPGY